MNIECKCKSHVVANAIQQHTHIQTNGPDKNERNTYLLIPNSSAAKMFTECTIVTNNTAIEYSVVVVFEPVKTIVDGYVPITKAFQKPIKMNLSHEIHGNSGTYKHIK